MPNKNYRQVNGNDKVHFVSNYDLDDSQIEDLKFAPHKNTSINIACFRVSRRSCRRSLLAVLCIILLIFLIVLVAKVAHHEKKHLRYKSSNFKDFGLFYAPQNPDESPIIRFSPLHKSYKTQMQSLDDILHSYTLTEQLHGNFIDCSHDNHPQNKVCRMPLSALGKECSHMREYGYSDSRPCILLMLKLNQTEIPEPFTKESKDWANVETLLGNRYSQNHIGITCDGDTEFDRKHILPDPISGKSIVYTPPNGFPTYFYPRSIDDSYLPPVVMVQFERLTTDVPVNIKCVAWAENFNNGHPQSSEKYTAEFEITIVSYD